MHTSSKDNTFYKDGTKQCEIFWHYILYVFCKAINRCFFYKKIVKICQLFLKCQSVAGGSMLVLNRNEGMLLYSVSTYMYIYSNLLTPVRFTFCWCWCMRFPERSIKRTAAFSRKSTKWTAILSGKYKIAALSAKSIEWTAGVGRQWLVGVLRCFRFLLGNSLLTDTDFCRSETKEQHGEPSHQKLN